MKNRLFISYLTQLVVLTIFWLGISLPIEAVEIVTHWVPSEAYDTPGKAVEKAAKGEPLSKEEYESLAKDKGLVFYSGHLVWNYDEPNKPAVPVVIQRKGEPPLAWKINELEENIRLLQLEVADLKRKVEELSSK